MNKPIVTVLIDTYNYGHFIGEAIESVLSQDFPMERMEILVVDDGSTDDTAQRMEKYGDRIRYLPKPNGGQASAFNFGVGHSRGEIVAFLDADDYWLPGKLRRILQEFETNPAAGMVHHRLQELDTRTGGLRNGIFTALSGNVATSRKSILSFNPTATSSLAFRRWVLEKILPIPEAVTIQADGYIQALAPFLAPIAAIDEVLAVYRFHGSNLYFLSQTEKDKETRGRRALTLRAIVEGLEEWFRSHGYEVAQPVVRATVSRWTTLLEREEFAITPPGRIRFFRHLLKCHRNHLPLMTWRLRMINYFNAVGALIIGYERFPSLDKKREKVTRWLRGGGRTPLPIIPTGRPADDVGGDEDKRRE